MKRDYTVWRNAETYKADENATIMSILSNGKIEAYNWDLWTANILAAKKHDLPFISELFDTKTGPVIVCGAGPSLLKNIESVVSLREKGYGLIACDRALAVLKRHGITPDLTVSTECQPECEGFLSSMEPGETAALGLISCASTRDALVERGCKVYNVAYMSPESNMNKWMNEQFGRDVTCVRSGSIVGFIAVDIAFWMGYDAIYTIGNDLCYTDPLSCSEDTAILADGGNSYIRRLSDGRWTFPMFEGVARDFRLFLEWHPEMTFVDLSGGIAEWPKMDIKDLS